MNVKSCSNNYAVIYLPLNMCNEIRTSTSNFDDNSNESYLYIRIPTYINDYVFKYYNKSNDRWYLDSEMLYEWIPPIEQNYNLHKGSD